MGGYGLGGFKSMGGHFGMSATWILATKCTRVAITMQEMSVPTHLRSGDDLLGVIEATMCTWSTPDEKNLQTRSPLLRPRGRLLNLDEWGLTSPAW